MLPPSPIASAPRRKRTQVIWKTVAIDIDAQTIARAPEMDRLTCVCADVLDVHEPPADVTAAMNFSTFFFLDREKMLRYLRHAHQCLRPNGLLVMDAFGGPSSRRVCVETRDVNPPKECGLPSFQYQWEQRTFDPETDRAQCHIHFLFEDGRAMRDAFTYEWRLWRLPELLEMMREAGFARAEVWGREDASGLIRRRRRIPAAENWVAYVVGVKCDAPG